MLLPMGRAHDGGNRRSLWSAQHRKHASLFRTRPAVAPRASFGLRLARMMLFTSGRLGRNGNPLAGGESFGCRWFDFAGGGRADARLLGSGHHRIPDRKSTRLNSSHANISYAVFCLKKKKI